MKVLDNFSTYLKNINYKDFLKYLYIVLSIILLIYGFIIYRYFSQTAFLKKEFKKINNARQEAQVILSKYIQVKKQKEIVDEIIEKGKDFKLMQYFDFVAQKIGIASNIKSRDLSINDLENLTDKQKNYEEVRLSIQLINLNMKQLVEMLNEFEKNERVYTKSLEITKAQDGDTINVNIVIATIQPKAEILEITE